MTKQTSSNWPVAPSAESSASDWGRAPHIGALTLVRAATILFVHAIVPIGSAVSQSVGQLASVRHILAQHKRTGRRTRTTVFDLAREWAPVCVSAFPWFGPLLCRLGKGSECDTRQKRRPLNRIVVWIGCFWRDLHTKLDSWVCA